LKQRAKEAVKYISNYETTVVNYCKNSGYDSILCGHIHKPEITTIEGVKYYNCGSFIVGENTSYIIETLDGEIKLIK
jgi:UDP-2,3-diacylglucosamine pyrophosphatase LpxH